MTTTKASIGRIVHYVNLGDKDGKYPPEVQAAIITGVYKNDPKNETYPTAPGNNDPAKVGVVPANALGDTVDSMFVDLKVQYRTGVFDMKCVGFSPEPSRGSWTWPPRA